MEYFIENYFLNLLNMVGTMINRKVEYINFKIVPLPD